MCRRITNGDLDGVWGGHTPHGVRCRAASGGTALWDEFALLPTSTNPLRCAAMVRRRVGHPWLRRPITCHLARARSRSRSTAAALALDRAAVRLRPRPEG